VKSIAPDAPSGADFNEVQSQVSSTANAAIDGRRQPVEDRQVLLWQYECVEADFDANRDQLTDPDRIQPSQMLKIPAQS
jgi:hypothetical protein